MNVALGLALSLASAFALNWGWVAQHGAASSLPPLRLSAPLRSLRLLVSNVRWLVGFVVGLGGWGLYVAALALAPLSLVQAVSAGGIAILALLVRPSGREWVGVGVGTLGLVLLAVTLGHVSSGHATSSSAALVWLGASAAAAGTSALTRGAAGLGVAAGVLYAAGDVATKTAIGGGVRVVFVAALLSAHGLAFVCLQLGFQRGGALTTAGLSTLFTNALPIVAGIALFHERLPGGTAGALRVTAFALVVACAALLARPEQPGDPGTMAACSAPPSRISSPS